MQKRFDRRGAIKILGGLTAAGLIEARANAACCYFAAKDKDVLQPAQKAFINWEPDCFSAANWITVSSMITT